VIYARYNSNEIFVFITYGLYLCYLLRRWNWKSIRRQIYRRRI